MTTPMVFVFGSNEAGVHGAGAALHAEVEHGAQRGCGFGYCAEVIYPNMRKPWKPCQKREGSVIKSHSFAIPTKDYAIEKLSIKIVGAYVESFLKFAEARPELNFKVTQIGCGLAGFTKDEIAPLFGGGQANIYYDTAWKEFLSDESKFWGTL